MREGWCEGLTVSFTCFFSLKQRNRLSGCRNLWSNWRNLRCSKSSSAREKSPDVWEKSPALWDAVGTASSCFLRYPSRPHTIPHALSCWYVGCFFAVKDVKDETAKFSAFWDGQKPKMCWKMCENSRLKRFAEFQNRKKSFKIVKNCLENRKNEENYTKFIVF